MRGYEGRRVAFKEIKKEGTIIPIGEAKIRSLSGKMKRMTPEERKKADIMELMTWSRKQLRGTSLAPAY